MTNSVFAQLPYPVKSTLAFIAFYAVGLPMLGLTMIGVLYTMPQWVAIGTLFNFVFYGELHTRSDWYLLGTGLYAAVGLISGLVLGKFLPRPHHLRGILASLIVFQVLIYGSIFVVQALGIWSPLDGW